MAVGTDPVTGRTLQRSVMFRGEAVDAEAYRRRLADEYGRRRAASRAAPLLTVEELLGRWLVADHPWKPSTMVGYRSAARGLAQDRRLAATRIVSLTPVGHARCSPAGRPTA